MAELGAPFVMSSAIGYTPLLLISSRFVDGSSPIERDTECYCSVNGHEYVFLLTVSHRTIPLVGLMQIAYPVTLIFNA